MPRPVQGTEAQGLGGVSRQGQTNYNSTPEERETENEPESLVKGCLCHILHIPIFSLSILDPFLCNDRNDLSRCFLCSHPKDLQVLQESWQQLTSAEQRSLLQHFLADGVVNQAIVFEFLGMAFISPFAPLLDPQRRGWLTSLTHVQSTQSIRSLQHTCILYIVC